MSLDELWTSAQAAAADEHTMGELGLPSPVLMERAALAVAAAVEARVPRPGETPIEVLCGPGNNGADGWAVARILRARGHLVGATRCAAKGNAAVLEQADWAARQGVRVRSLESWIEQPPDVGTVYVDALLGTGSRGAPRGTVAQVIEWLSSRPSFVVAVDVPSGVDPDTGVVASKAIGAAVTVTFQRSKPGLHIVPGREHAGHVVVADIGLVGVPPTVAMTLVTLDWVRRCAPPRRLADHKGRRGHVGIVGGTGGTPGAAVLAGLSALRAGAGLATWFVEPPIGAGTHQRPEIMVGDLHQLSSRSDLSALVIGPGLTAPFDSPGRPGIASWLASAYLGDTRPAVFDAGALAEVAFDAVPIATRCLTPHPGEAAQLMTRLTSERWQAVDVQADRLHVARTLARRSGAIVLLKGAGTVVAGPDDRVAVLAAGSDRLATAGSGDCLAGAIAASLPQDPDPWAAVCRAAFLHALAGELANGRFPGCVAGDIVDALGPAREVVDVFPDAVATWRRQALWSARRHEPAQYRG